jgi:hypothetical protein
MDKLLDLASTAPRAGFPVSTGCAGRQRAGARLYHGLHRSPGGPRPTAEEERPHHSSRARSNARKGLRGRNGAFGSGPPHPLRFVDAPRAGFPVSTGCAGRQRAGARLYHRLHRSPGGPRPTAEEERPHHSPRARSNARKGLEGGPARDAALHQGLRNSSAGRAGEELRLVLARQFELAALLLNLAEQARVLNGAFRADLPRAREKSFSRPTGNASAPAAMTGRGPAFRESPCWQRHSGDDSGGARTGRARRDVRLRQPGRRRCTAKNRPSRPLCDLGSWSCRLIFANSVRSLRSFLRSFMIPSP